MGVTAAVGEAARFFKPRPLPPGVGEVIITSRHGIRVGMRVGAAVVGGGTVAAGLSMDDETRSRRLPLLVLGGASSAALAGASLLVRDSRAAVLKTGLASLEDAIVAANGFDRSTGVLEHANQFHVLDLNRLYDLDRLVPSELTSFRVGDGKVSFAALVTQDGDLLKPISAAVTRGYENMGAAAPRLHLASLAGKSPAAIDAAVAGLQVGTDAGHATLTIGRRAGAASGYASAEAMFRDTFQKSGRETIGLQVDGRVHAFEAVGPARQATRLRGTALEPMEGVTIASRKALWRGTAPGEHLAFTQRLVPFTPDEPVGQLLHMRGLSGVPSRHLGSYPSLADARSAVREVAHGDWESRGLIETPYYAIVQGDTAQGAFHVYRRSGAQSGVWESELGAVKAMTWTDTSKRVNEFRQGDYIIQEKYRRTAMYLRGDTIGDRLIKETSWYHYDTDRVYRPLPKRT